MIRNLTLMGTCALLAATLLAACGDDGTGGNTADDDVTDVRGRPDSGDDDVRDPPNSDTDVDCEENADCHDENPCTIDRCEASLCVYLPNVTTPPSPIPGNCQRETCQDGILVLTSDDDDAPADDGFECTSSWCDAGTALNAADDSICDDDNRCNGIEYCDIVLGCQDGPPADDDEDGESDVSGDPNPPDADNDGIIDCADWETCDGIDNDGNGLVDDNPSDSVLGEVCYD